MSRSMHIITCFKAVTPFRGISSEACLLFAQYLSIPNLGDEAPVIENTFQVCLPM